MSMVMILIPLVFIMLLVLVVAATRGKTQEGGEDVIKNVYLYLVLFATLMMVIGGSVGVFMALADLVAPAPYYQSYEDYARWQTERPSKEDPEVVIERSEEEIRASYDAMVASEKDRQVQRAKNSLIKSFGWIVIPLPIFFLFQRMLKAS